MIVWVMVAIPYVCGCAWTLYFLVCGGLGVRWAETCAVGLNSKYASGVGCTCRGHISNGFVLYRQFILQ